MMDLVRIELNPLTQQHWMIVEGGQAGMDYLIWSQGKFFKLLNYKVSLRGGMERRLEMWTQLVGHGV